MADPRNPGGPDHPFGRPRPNGPHSGPSNGNSNGNGRHGGRPHGVPNRPIPFPAGGRQGGTRPEPEDEFADEPLDLVAVQADDELINALSAGMMVSSPGRGGYDADDKVVAMLAAWKAEVDAEPIPQLVDLDTAVAAVESGTVKKPSSRRRHLIPLAGAAALLVFSIGGVSIGAQSASPGDALFPVTQVLYKDAANSKVAAAEVQQRIQQVNAKLASGDTVGAQQDLQALAPLLEQVRPEEGKTYLAAEQTFLQQKVVETPPGQPVDPRAPLRNGTPRPAAPVTEGSQDPSESSSTNPSSSDPASSSTSAPVVPAPESGVTNPGPGPGPDTVDPRTLKGPGGGEAGGDPDPSTSTSPTTPPVTEGGQDPTTPTSTTVPPSDTTTTTSMGETTSETTSAEATTTTS
ncbi:anti-sigma-D factor RsdA [Pseudonocardia pini]|uniref:anti-sigma-D factor RsdA n=1 Tax=Pseudonocardia pini TaxID=2758030 RepID=UPI0015F00803|nr:anti-sigma-D factor RsdA [Pseudonocardia pini]